MRTLPITLLLMFLAVSLARADDAPTPSAKMADFIRVSFDKASGRLEFKPVLTGDPTIDDGSEVLVPAVQRLATQIYVNRGPSGTIVSAASGPHRGTQIGVSNGSASVVGFVTIDGAEFQITYGQSPGGQAGKDANVHLWARGPDGIVRVNVTEPSFAELCRNHPADVAKYMVPLFMQWDTGVIYVHPDEARLAFASQMPPDPQASAALEGILPRLNDDDAATRDSARKDLAALGPRAVPTLVAMDLSKVPLQTRIAIRALLEPLARANDPRLKDIDFLTLCLAVDDPQIPALAKTQLEKITGKPLDFDVKAPLTDRRAASLKLLVPTK